MPILNKCCCCSLRTGAIISGVLGVVVAIPTLILIFVLNIKMKTIIIDSLPQDIVKIIIALNLVMTVLICVLLIWGAVKRNKFIMLPWIMLTIMIAIGGLISVIWTAVVLYNSDLESSNTTATLLLVFGLLGVVFVVYLWLVVLSYYQQLVEESHRGVYGKVPHRQ